MPAGFNAYDQCVSNLSNGMPWYQKTYLPIFWTFMRSDEPQAALSDPVFQNATNYRKNFLGRDPENISSTEFQLKSFSHPESKGHRPFHQEVQSMAFSFHSCRMRTFSATIFRSRLSQRHAYSNRSRDLKKSPRVKYPQQFSPAPAHIRRKNPSGFQNFLHSVLPKDRREHLGRRSAYTGLYMIDLLGAFWLSKQEEVLITGRKRFNFIRNENMEEIEH
jgi:hypothetical protein